MDSLVKATLITQTQTYDTLGQVVNTETTTEVWATKRSVTRQEWFDAGSNDFNPEFQIELYNFEYGGQAIVEVDDVRYSVYRTYTPINSDLIELYLQKQGGVAYVADSN